MAKPRPGRQSFGKTEFPDQNPIFKPKGCSSHVFFSPGWLILRFQELTYQRLNLTGFGISSAKCPVSSMGTSALGTSLW